MQSTTDLTAVIEESLETVFKPTFLGVITPWVVTLIIAGIIRGVFRAALRGHRKMQALVDGVLCILTLVVCYYVPLPMTIDFIQNTPLF